MYLEGGEGVPVMHGPMQANVVPHPLQGPLQTDGAKKKQYHGQERHVGKIREEGDFHDDDDEPPSRSRHKKRTNERRTKRSRRNSSGGSSSSSQSGRSSHGRFPKKGVGRRFPHRKREIERPPVVSSRNPKFGALFAVQYMIVFLQQERFEGALHVDRHGYFLRSAPGNQNALKDLIATEYAGVKNPTLAAATGSVWPRSSPVAPVLASTAMHALVVLVFGSIAMSTGFHVYSCRSSEVTVERGWKQKARHESQE
ncbi:hypothetical protein L7F22_066508 [Adiantum nelumboides]|nr:hypothetical protein [Adiantum nelumboides]